jgi:hypothetical protein
MPKIPLWWGLSRKWIASLLLVIGPTYPVKVGVVIILLGVVALTAGYFPLGVSHESTRFSLPSELTAAMKTAHCIRMPDS